MQMIYDCCWQKVKFWTLQAYKTHTFIEVYPAFKSNKLLLPFNTGQLTAVRPNNGAGMESSFDQVTRGSLFYNW